MTTSYWAGKKRDEATKHKISLSLKGRIHPPRTKEIIDKWRLSRAGYKHSLETRDKISKNRGRAGTFFGPHSAETKKAISLATIKRYALHPESHPNRILAKKQTKGYVSFPQKKIFMAIQKLFPEATLEFPVLVGERTKYLDIAILSLKINIEYDGEYWHRNSQKTDALRDAQLSALGWRVIRINKTNIKTFLDGVNNGIVA